MVRTHDQRKPQTAPSAGDAILRAALNEFAEEGYAGARTDHIARSAGVNIALLFYYFKSKDRLYGAVLEKIFADWVMAAHKSLRLKLPPAEKLLAFVSSYFDFVAAAPTRPRLVQQEMMRRGRVGSPHIRRMVRKYIKPVHLEIRKLIRKGIAERQFHPLDPEHTVYSITGIINFYFASSPVIELLGDRDPLAAASIKRRKREVLKLIGNAIIKKERER